MSTSTGKTARAKPAAGGVEAVDRALAILGAFDEAAPELGLAELAARTGLYKSTILRIAASLERGRMLSRDAESRRWRPGTELWRLGLLHRRGDGLGERVRPALARLVEATGETASFYVRDREERICLYRLNSPRAARHHLDEGVRLPLERGATGRVLVAFGGGTGEPSETIRAAGGHVSVGERDRDVVAAAVPVFDAGGAFRGALGVSGLAARFTPETARATLDLLRAEAAAIAG